MKNLILSCLAVLGLVSFVGCSDSDKSTSTSSTTQSSAMQTDTKDVRSH